MTTINMQIMRYINILDRASRVKTKNCFIYNNMVFFAVPKYTISKAIGPNAINARKIEEQIGKKIRIIEEPDGITSIERFITDIVSPIKFKLIEIKDNTVVLTAGSTTNKAALIGRNKRRFDELRKILMDNFGLDLKII
ncbi:MAG: hypothetical protein N3D20_01595 [Candidatus Pacearchaeota archaeon]|nr:hypothetical protein [Candidatus Pacearchaeota archaeon]